MAICATNFDPLSQPLHPNVFILMDYYLDYESTQIVKHWYFSSITSTCKLARVQVDALKNKWAPTIVTSE